MKKEQQEKNVSTTATKQKQNDQRINKKNAAHNKNISFTKLFKILVNLKHQLNLRNPSVSGRGICEVF